MIPSSRGRDFEGKREVAGGGDGQDGDENSHTSMILQPPSSSRQWSAFRNPRIVRVSRSFGGKDRHSKVCTVRGLRDRRIRLSVPTAILLYDLQDRLGVGQPSKAIDWLLEAAKDDIDKLPPLQLPATFGHQYLNHHLLFNNSSVHNAHEPLVFHNPVLAPLFDNSDQAKVSWDLDTSNSLRDQRIGQKESLFLGMEKGKWVKSEEERGTIHHHQYQHGQSSNQSRLFPNFLNNDPSTLTLSSQLNNHSYGSQQDQHNHDCAAGGSNSSMSQLYLYPTTGTMPPFFPTPLAVTANSAMETHENLRRLNHFHLLGSSSQHNLPNALTLGSTLRPFHQLMNGNQGFGGSQRNEEINRSCGGDTDD